MAKYRIISLLVAAWPLAAPLASGAQQAPVITTTQGRLAGSSNDGIDRFLAVPFAAPPTGALRWRPTRAAAGWRGTRDATAPGPICIQDSINNPLTAGYAPAQSEDCLYLNIFRPSGKRTGALPVMVWIHGGAFIMGSGGMPDYDGAALAKHGAIIVTINYRLGRFGQFAHPALSAEQPGAPLANYGLMDQIAALRWVRANARSLGGDAHNVTVMGESAGASSVNFLMTSPVARGLFDKAISQSGGANSGLQTLAAAQQDGERWARGKGAATIAELRALSASAVLDAPVRVPATPVIDGRIVVGSTSDMFSRGDVAPVPYLVGANDHEESLMRWLPGAGQKLVASLGDRAEAVIALYQQPGEERAAAIARMWGESSMVLPALRRAQQQALRGEAVWLYRFSYVPQALRATRAGVGHADELPLVFDVPLPAQRAGWTRKDAAMAYQVGAYWVAFARSGNPNHTGAPQWPRFARPDSAMLTFGADGPLTTFPPFARLANLDAAIHGSDRMTHLPVEISSPKPK